MMKNVASLFVIWGLGYSFLGYIFRVKKIDSVVNMSEDGSKDVYDFDDTTSRNMYLLSAVAFLFASLVFFFPNLATSLVVIFMALAMGYGVYLCALGRNYLDYFYDDEAASDDEQR